MTFSDFSLAEQLVRATRRAGFAQPTPIQCDAIPPILEGRDILASAQTGSGKTAAFLLPIMDRLLPLQRGATRALVVAPTRELAAQISDHFRILSEGTGLRSAAVHGGVGMGSQERAFRKGVDLIAATPGRLLDHFSRPYAGLEDLRFLVLDEADRMLDMGFLPDIRRILARIPRKRQTMLFSATLPEPIVTLSRELLHDPVRLNIGRPPGPAPRITHSVYPVSTERKQGLFLELLGRVIPGSVLVFTRTKHRANRLADFLDTNGVPCARIHGNRSQSQRSAALAGFRQGRFKVLVATDIAARGIDVEALGSVVNFDVPHVPEDYIHRVGRTARAEASGDAFTPGLARRGEGPACDRDAHRRTAAPARTSRGSTTLRPRPNRPGHRAPHSRGRPARPSRGSPARLSRGRRARPSRRPPHACPVPLAARRRAASARFCPSRPGPSPGAEGRPPPIAPSRDGGGLRRAAFGRILGGRMKRPGDSILSAASSLRDSTAQTLSDLVRIASPSGGEEKVCRRIAELCREARLRRGPLRRARQRDRPHRQRAADARLRRPRRHGGRGRPRPVGRSTRSRVSCRTAWCTAGAPPTRRAAQRP